jgi:hypothetical protein
MEVSKVIPAMDSELNPTLQRELTREEEEILEDYTEPYRPRVYRPVFYAPPDGDWKLEALYSEGFFESAKLLLQGVIDGTLPESRESVAAVFLCRHYLELAIKYTLFHSRWLKDDDTNATNEEIAAVENNHNLQSLWDTLKRELETRLPRIVAVGFDLDFVGAFVADFHQTDKSGCRFRYPTKEFAVVPSGETPILDNSLDIDFPALLFNLQHAERVLTSLDGYLVDKHGLNAEWVAELNSF